MSLAKWKMILYKRKYIMNTKEVNGWTLTSFCVLRNTNQPFDTLLKYKNNNTQFHFEIFSHLIFHDRRGKNVSRLFTHGKDWETCGDWHIRRQKIWVYKHLRYKFRMKIFFLASFIYSLFFIKFIPGLFFGLQIAPKCFQ